MGCSGADGTTDAELSVALSKLATQRRGPSAATPSAESDELLLAVTAFQDLARIAHDLQGQAVRAAHESGVSWTKLGALLGISRQAVQQRFDPNYLVTEPSEPSLRILGPVSRAEELRHLKIAGAQGWRLIRARHGEHELQRTSETWDIKRVSIFSPRPMPTEREGWVAAATRFPDCFYTRPTPVDQT